MPVTYAPLFALRLYPATHLLRGLQEDMVLLGYRIPKGVSVYASLHHCNTCCALHCCVQVFTVCMVCIYVHVLSVSVSIRQNGFGIHTCGAKQ